MEMEAVEVDAERAEEAEDVHETLDAEPEVEVDRVLYLILVCIPVYKQLFINRFLIGLVQMVCF
jgi:hypothetical protein